MKRNGTRETLTFENPDLVAFIKINQSINPRPTMRHDGKVLFTFNEDVTQSLDDFTNNKPIGAQDLINAIRSVRALMYAFKSNGGRA